MTADDFVIFLKGLIRKNPKQKLIMICDNASIHNAAVVKNWLTRHHTLQIRHLPPYAPKHNPVEFANQVLKSRLRYSAATDKKGNSLLLGIQMMFSFMLVDEDKPLRLCKHCQKVFWSNRANAAFCSARCKNQYNVYKSRGKYKEQDGDGNVL